MIDFLDLRGQYAAIKPEMDAAIASVVDNAAFIGGKGVADFEQAFAAYQGAGHCVGVGNGTDALEIAIEALELPPASEILVPANSFIATSEAVTRTGHVVRFVDADPLTYLVDLEDLERRTTDRTAALICVHLYGRPCDMGALARWGERHATVVIEDAAQAHGAEWDGRRVGALGRVGTFSFYPGKNLGAYGDGGAIVTDDEQLAARCRMIANHGRIEKYDHQMEGRNSRLDALQAAVLTVKLRHLDGWVDRRNAVAAAYVAGLSGVPGLELADEDFPGRHARHLFVVRSERRDALRMHLSERGIGTGIHYPISLPRLGAYAYLGVDPSTFRADQFGARLLSLPMGEHLSDADIATVVEAVREFHEPRF